MSGGVAGGVGGGVGGGVAVQSEGVEGIRGIDDDGSKRELTICGEGGRSLSKVDELTGDCNGGLVRFHF